MICNICPRECNIDRERKKGFCGMGEKPVAARAFLHMWEEPCISGTRGSGTVFFSGCSLKCIFCQNHEISHGGRGRELSTTELAGVFLSLQEKGAHNINLVTPTHFVPAILEALNLAKGGKDVRGFLHDIPGGESCEMKNRPLEIPVVYNTNGYESLETLDMLNGSIDIYLPDLKYVSPDVSKEYSGAVDYFVRASKAILEMARQVGSAVFDETGMMKRGMIVRHLVLPGHTSETIKVLEWIAGNLPKDTHVSLMSQFIPCFKAVDHPVIGRSLTRHEYDKVVNKFVKLGLNGFVQERESASTQFIPDFDQTQF